MKRIVFFVFWLLGTIVSAQNVTNVDFEQVGDEIIITYDLAVKSDVRIHVSLDEGSYRELSGVSGDVGKAVSPGKKRIVWNVLYYIPEGLAVQVRFKVSTMFDIMDDMVYVKGGTFMMGATEEQDDDVWDNEKPVHQVTLSDYYISKFEVTQGLWKAVMGSNPSSFKKGDDYPVECVSWNDIQTFLTNLNRLTGKKYALPTEAQWEYAARGGGKSVGYKYSGSNTIGDVAWYGENSAVDGSRSTHPVGTKCPNELGIYDMSGNVWEWCSDWSGFYSNGSQSNPTGPSTGSYRVLRGGSWNYNARYCRVSNRYDYAPGDRYNYNGFRVVLLP